MRFTTPQLVFGLAAIVSVMFMLFFVSSYKGNPLTVQSADSTTAGTKVSPDVAAANSINVSTAVTGSGKLAQPLS